MLNQIKVRITLDTRELFPFRFSGSVGGSLGGVIPEVKIHTFMFGMIISVLQEISVAQIFKIIFYYSFLYNSLTNISLNVR